MKTCPRCTHHNRDGELVCERCRQPLSNYHGLATRQMKATLDFDDELPVHFDTSSTAYSNKITVELAESGERLSVENQKRIVIGRSSTHSVRTPDVDLAPFHAFSKGVSSLHASIFRADDCVSISDLGSTNGTYLNREGLIPHQAYPLHNGDLIYLGQMAVRVYF
ncbi:MAG: FHA domain-containing protein [Anaerolineae bacterium]|nr:FHA domain-containing protein [Anaerolineae bacterium]